MPKTRSTSAPKSEWPGVSIILIFVFFQIIEVGFAKISADQVLDVIAAKDRCEAGTSAPAKGLFLAQVEYPKNIVS